MREPLREVLDVKIGPYAAAALSEITFNEGRRQRRPP
jgi:hypothetical protein